MSVPARPPRPLGRPVARALTAVALAGLAAACSSAVGAPGGPTPAPAASEAEWRALATPRPTPLADAPRIALGDVTLLSTPRWSAGTVSPTLGLAELIAAGLLRRADVRFVERRRFAAAAEAERTGAERPVGAPRAGVSLGAELVAHVVWAPVGGSSTSLEVRLVAAATGAVVVTRRALAPEDADPVGLARLAVGTVLAALGEAGRRPAWSDPVPGAAPEAFASSGIAPDAVADFHRGLAAEETWSWESARVAYTAAARARDFVEASAALARTARLRLGATLGES